MLIHMAVDNDVYPPRFGGAQRTFGLARGLARRHRVRLLGVVPNRTASPREETAHGVELVRRKAWHTSLCWRLERAGIAPMFSAEPGHRANAARYREALGGGADVVATDLSLSGLLPPRGTALAVYASQNVELDRFVEEAPRLAARAHWTRVLRRLEGDTVARADLTVVCTQEDAARMRELYGAEPSRLEVIPNGFDETELRPPSPAERAAARAALGIAGDDYVAVFVGADWGPNREALAALTGRVMPALAGGRFRLLVVGRVAGALGARREPWLIAHGEAPALLPMLHAADAGVNPVISGGGSNVKVPGYLAAGLAVIGTPFGLRGYAPLAPYCTVAPIEDFAGVLADRPRGWSVRGAAPPEPLAEYAWGRLGERLGELCASRLDRARATRGAA